MINIVGMRGPEAKNAVNSIEEMFPEATKSIREPKGKVGDYLDVEITFETVDPILGGTPSNGDMLKLRVDYATNKPSITPAQFKGWVRQNGRRVGWNANARSWIGYAPAVPVGDYELIEVEAPVTSQGRGVGKQKYEAFAPGTVLKTVWAIPLRGQGIEGVEDVERLFETGAVNPVRGLGANPYYYGGRVKLLEAKTK